MFPDLCLNKIIFRFQIPCSTNIIGTWIKLTTWPLIFAWLKLFPAFKFQVIPIYFEQGWHYPHVPWFVSDLNYLQLLMSHKYTLNIECCFQIKKSFTKCNYTKTLFNISRKQRFTFLNCNIIIVLHMMPWEKFKLITKMHFSPFSPLLCSWLISLEKICYVIFKYYFIWLKDENPLISKLFTWV